MVKKIEHLELNYSDYQQIQNDLGTKIKIWRVKKKISIFDLSNSSGISGGYLSRLENGKVKQPSLFLYLRVCYALNINPADFFSDIPDYFPFDADDYHFIP